MHHIVRGIAHRVLKPVSPKASIALRLDADVLEWFKAQGRVIRLASTLFSGRSEMRRSNSSLEPTPVVKAPCACLRGGAAPSLEQERTI